MCLSSRFISERTEHWHVHTKQHCLRRISESFSPCSLKNTLCFQWPLGLGVRGTKPSFLTTYKKPWPQTSGHGVKTSRIAGCWHDASWRDMGKYLLTLIAQQRQTKEIIFVSGCGRHSPTAGSSLSCSLQLRALNTRILDLAVGKNSGWGDRSKVSQFIKYGVSHGEG